MLALDLAGDPARGAPGQYPPVRASRADVVWRDAGRSDLGAVQPPRSEGQAAGESLDQALRAACDSDDSGVSCDANVAGDVTRDRLLWITRSDGGFARHQRDAAIL